MNDHRGKHLILDLYGCQTAILNDKVKIDKLLTECVKISGATVEGKLFKQFEPNGISAVFLLSESHISVHVWPDQKYASIDMYTCGQKCDPSNILDLIEKTFDPEQFTHRLIERGVP